VYRVLSWTDVFVLRRDRQVARDEPVDGPHPRVQDAGIQQNADGGQQPVHEKRRSMDGAGRLPVIAWSILSSKSAAHGKLTIAPDTLEGENPLREQELRRTVRADVA
jgi:hypothetical protein